MSLSKISEVGGVIQGNWNDEHIITGIADGSAKAGHCVGLTAAGVVDGTETTNETFAGILLPHFEVDMDTAITSGKIVSIVVPQSGHLYGILCGDLDSSLPGYSLEWTANAGLPGKQTDISLSYIARIYKYTDGDTVGIFIWGT